MKTQYSNKELTMEYVDAIAIVAFCVFAAVFFYAVDKIPDVVD